MKKIFELHQKFTMLINEYRVLDGDQLIGFASQKRFAMREKFTLYSDEAKSEVIASSQSRNVMDIASTLDVFDESGKKLAIIRKEFAQSLGISTWTVLDATEKNELFTVREKAAGIALFRRVWQFLPFLGDIPFIFKFHFVILHKDKLVGEFNKLTLFRDHYALYLDDSAVSRLDKRVWMIMSVLLDSQQGR